jgi:hypothetical protein
MGKRTIRGKKHRKEKGRKQKYEYDSDKERINVMWDGDTRKIVLTEKMNQRIHLKVAAI